MRSKLTYGNVMSTLAVFIALGGTSYAAVTITSKHVRNNSLTGRDIRNSSLTGNDVRDGSLRARDFGRGQLPAGPQGPAGAQGPTGPQGPGAPLTGSIVVSHLEFEAASQITTRFSGCSRAAGTMFAPVQLPTGTRVTKVDVYVRDVMPGPGDEIDMRLRRTQLPTHASDVIASASSTGGTGNQVLTLTPPEGTTWASTDTPMLEYEPESGTEHEICGAVVHYGAL